MKLEVIAPRWEGRTCIVAAPGPSLTEAVAEQCRAACLPTIAVNDAWRRLPWADVLYGCDSASGRWTRCATERAGRP